MSIQEVAQETIYTEDDVLRLSNQQDGLVYELHDGELIRMSANGFMHVMVTGNAYSVLRDFAHPRKLGYVAGDGLIYVLYIHPVTRKRTLQIPDCSFIRKEHVPKDYDFSRSFPGAPDLAIEIMSPDDTAEDVLKRIRRFFLYGTEQVWVFYPDSKEVHQHFNGDSQIKTYSGDDVIDGSAFFPGLTLVTKDLFALPDMD
jgi:Uma2 family endonuclease